MQDTTPFQKCRSSSKTLSTGERNKTIYTFSSLAAFVNWLLIIKAFLSFDFWLVFW